MRRDYPERPLVGVGAVIWRGARFLLIRRAKPPKQGQWSLPGGAQQLGETVEEAVRREVREETALELETLRVIATVDLIDRDDEGSVRYHYTLIDVTAEAPRGVPIAGSDAAEVGWFELDHVDELGLWHETCRIIRLAASERVT